MIGGLSKLINFIRRTLGLCDGLAGYAAGFFGIFIFTAIFNCSFLQISCKVQCWSLTGAKTNYSLNLPTISLSRSANWESASAAIFTWELLFDSSPDAWLTSEISLAISPETVELCATFSVTS